MVEKGVIPDIELFREFLGRYDLFDFVCFPQEPIYITKDGEGDLVLMSIDAFERLQELHKLRARLDAAEQGFIAGAPTYTIEESRKRLERIYASEA